ncbi:MAG: hypothetical protein WDN30_10655 [Pararobbsia sp.]
MLSAFQSVEDSLSALNHERQQTQSLRRHSSSQRATVRQRTRATAGRRGQRAGPAPTAQLTLILARQNLADSQALLAQSSVSLSRIWAAAGQRDEPDGTARDRSRRARPPRRTRRPPRAPR